MGCLWGAAGGGLLRKPPQSVGAAISDCSEAQSLSTSSWNSLNFVTKLRGSSLTVAVLVSEFLWVFEEVSHALLD